MTELPMEQNGCCHCGDGDRAPQRPAPPPANRAVPTWKLVIAVIVAALPNWLKRPIYRLCYGYAIGRRVRIGFGTVLVDLRQCRIEDDVRLGVFNVFSSIGDLVIGKHTRIGHLNVFRGGERVTLGPYVTVLRGNVFNSGQLNDFVTPRRPVLELGMGTFVATGHWIDFTDSVSFGAECILGGRGSSIWTHNRQRTRAVRFGPQCYLGSDIRVAPGVEVASQCIVSLGAVLTGRFPQPQTFIAGNPATASRPLNDHDLYHVSRKTRDDIPDELHGEIVPIEPVAPPPRRATTAPPASEPSCDLT
jgi:acetyltransferase-like isoleucine patch superfamily enzyme